MKNYTKVKMVAKNAPTGSYAAGCPEKDRGWDVGCLNCERTRQSLANGFVSQTVTQNHCLGKGVSPKS